MSAGTEHPAPVHDLASSPICACGSPSTAAPAAAAAERGRRLVSLDRAVGSGQVTPAEAAERRVQLLAR